jgi:predicted extracellular nuclease
MGGASVTTTITTSDTSVFNGGAVLNHNYVLNASNTQIYGDASQSTITGDVTINAALANGETVTLKNLTINGTLNVDVQNGHVTLDNTTAGTINVISGGTNSIEFLDGSRANIVRVTDSDGIRLWAHGSDIVIGEIDIEPTSDESEVQLEGNFKNTKIKVKKAAKVKAQELKLTQPIVVEVVNASDEVTFDGDLEDVDGGVEVRSNAKIKLKNSAKLRKLVAKGEIQLVDETGVAISADKIAESIDQLSVEPGSNADIRAKLDEVKEKRANKCSERLEAVKSSDFDGEKDIKKAEKAVERAERIIDSMEDGAQKDALKSKLNEAKAKIEEAKHPVKGTTIMQIQGEAFKSPLEKQVVKNVRGIVTYIKGSSFYMQDANGDGNDATSDAVLVYAGSEKPADLAVGDDITLETAEVVEYYAYNKAYKEKEPTSETELKNVKIKINSKGNALPAPVVLGNGGRAVPTKWVDNDGMKSFDANEDGIDFYESLEGMRVSVNDGLIVGAKPKYGEFQILADGGVASSDKLTINDGIKLSDYDDNPEIITVYHAQTKSDYKSGNGLDVTTGDSFKGSVTGFMTYSFGKYKIDFVESLPELKDCNRKRSSERTSLKGLSNGLTVASYNLENFSVANGGDRERATAFGDSIVNDLNNPDILCLMEIQDDSGDATDGTVVGTATAQILIDAISAAGGSPYQYTEIAPQDGKDGGKPGANIRVGILYRDDRVSFKTAPHGDATTAVEMDGKNLSLNPGRIDPSNSAFSSSRKSLVAQFEFNGKDVFVIANHLCSKRGDGSVYGEKQPAFRGSELKRHEQAQAINDFADEIKAANPEAAIIVLGDMNDFEFSKTTDIIEGSRDDMVLYNMVNTLPESERISYVFNGNSQVLDNIFVSSDKKEQTEIDMVNINAEYSEAAGRVSDHDPVIIRMTLGEAYSYTDTEAIAKAKEALEIAGAQAVVKDFVLSQTGLYGTNITWTEDHDAIEIVGGKAVVTRPAQDTADADGTITATIAKGSESDTKVFNVKVLKRETPISIADAKTKVGETVLIEGVATSASGIWGSNRFYIADGSAGIFVNDGGKDKFVAGQKLRIKGIISEYNGEFQLGSIVEIEKGNIASAPDAEVIGFDQITEDKEGSLVKMNRLVIKNLRDAGYGTVEFEGLNGENSICVRMDNRSGSNFEEFAKIYQNGSVVDVTGLLGEYSGKKQLKPRGIPDFSAVSNLSDSEAVEIAKAVLDIGNVAQVVKNLTLVDSAVNGVNITWSSENEDILSNSGAVTRPSSETGDQLVKLHATLTKGEANASKTFDVTVKALSSNVMSDLIISEYVEGSGNNKALEIYNGTGSDIDDLSNYSLVKYTNGDGNQTAFALEGSLGNGETYVIVTSGADAALKAKANKLNDIASFNGDDPLVLKKGDVVIDSFGVVGPDPGDCWGEGDKTTKDHTLVRKSSVLNGDTDISDAFDLNQWDFYGKNDNTHLGSHIVD